MGKNRDSLFDWLVRRAEADLGVAQALALCETQRTDQINQLEATLVGQINKLQCQIVESREAELMDLKAEIFACADRIARFENTQSTADAAKQAVQEFGDLRTNLSARQTELEARYSALEELAESIGTDVRTLKEDLRDKLDGLKSAQTETRHFQSETRSLADRIAQAESATWQARTLASRNAEQLERSIESLRSEIASLNTSVAQLSNKQRERRLPDALLQEQGAKIEEIQKRLVQTQNGQTERDARLGQLDSGLCALAERITQIAEISDRSHALIEAEMNSAAGFRERTAQELSGIEARLNDSAIHHKLRELELALCAKVQESQHQAAQKFMLLQARDAERENNAREFLATVGARLAEHEARTDEKLRVFGSDRDELCRVQQELQTLAEGILEANSAIHRAQARADASTNGLAQIENRLSNEIAGLDAEIAKIAEQQRAIRSPHDHPCEIEGKLGGALDEIQRQAAIEREGLDHWAKGLRESFAAELIGVQARLSERLSQIEHRYMGLEHSQAAVKASVAGWEIELQKNLQSQTDEHQEFSRVTGDLAALAERMKHLENRAGQAEQRAAAFTRDVEQRASALQHEIRMVVSSLDQRGLSSFDSIARSLEEKLGAKLGEIEERFTDRLSQYNGEVSDRVRQSEEIASRAHKELAALRTALESQGTASPDLAFPPAFHEGLSTKLDELEQKIAARFNQIENRDAERAQHFNTISERLETEVAAVKASLTQRTEASHGSSMPALQGSLDQQMRHFQQHFEEKLILIEKRAEQAASPLNTETAALRAELTPSGGALAAADPVMLGLEEKLSAKIEELRNHMGERFSTFDRREAEIKEIAERAQSLIQPLIQAGAEIPRPHNTPVVAVQSLAPHPELNADVPRRANVKSQESLAEIQARSEKEQLVKLQERMSAEIERVRAELKERSGRWKVRKSAS